MSKITLTNLVNLSNPATAVSAINSNNSILETAMDNTLSRDGSSPNQMEATLDMNSNRIINIPNPASLHEPVTLEYLNGINPGIINNIPSNATFATLSLATAATIPVTTSIVQTGGYSTPGDKGGGTYRRSVSAPSHAGKFQSADGAWWELFGPCTDKTFGAAVDGVTYDDNAIIAMGTYIVATGYPFTFVSGTRKINQTPQLLWNFSGINNLKGTFDNAIFSLGTDQNLAPQGWIFIFDNCPNIHFQGTVTFAGNLVVGPGIPGGFVGSICMEFRNNCSNFQGSDWYVKGNGVGLAIQFRRQPTIAVDSTRPVTVTNGGSGYTNGATVTLNAGAIGPGTVSATFQITASAGVVTGITCTSEGNYPFVGDTPGFQLNTVTSSGIFTSGGGGTGLQIRVYGKDVSDDTRCVGGVLNAEAFNCYYVTGFQHTGDNFTVRTKGDRVYRNILSYGNNNFTLDSITTNHVQDAHIFGNLLPIAQTNLKATVTCLPSTISNYEEGANKIRFAYQGGTGRITGVDLKINVTYTTFAANVGGNCIIWTKNASDGSDNIYGRGDIFENAKISGFVYNIGQNDGGGGTGTVISLNTAQSWVGDVFRNVTIDDFNNLGGGPIYFDPRAFQGKLIIGPSVFSTGNISFTDFGALKYLGPGEAPFTATMDVSPYAIYANSLSDTVYPATGNVIRVTNNNTVNLKPSWTGKTFINDSAVNGETPFVLPPATQGLEYKFANKGDAGGSQVLSLDPNGTEKFRLGGAGKKFYIGSGFTDASIGCVIPGVWEVYYVNGTSSYEP